MNRETRCRNKIQHIADQLATISQIPDHKKDVPVAGANGIVFTGRETITDFNIWRIKLLGWAAQADQAEIDARIAAIRNWLGEETWANRYKVRLGKALDEKQPGATLLIVEASLLDIAEGRELN